MDRLQGMEDYRLFHETSCHRKKCSNFPGLLRPQSWEKKTIAATLESIRKRPILIYHLLSRPLNSPNKLRIPTAERRRDPFRIAAFRTIRRIVRSRKVVPLLLRPQAPLGSTFGARTSPATTETKAGEWLIELHSRKWEWLQQSEPPYRSSKQNVAAFTRPRPTGRKALPL